MLLEAYYVVAWLGLALNLWNGVPAQFNTAVKPLAKKLIDSSTKWTKNRTRRILRTGPWKRTASGTARARTRSATGTPFHLASGPLNQSQYDPFFGSQLPDIVPVTAHLSLANPATPSIFDLALRPSSEIQVYQSPACPALSLSFESSTDLDPRQPGHVHAYEPWRLATCLAIFVWPAAQCFSPPQLLPSGPTLAVIDDDLDLDWWNPWYVFLGVVFSFVFMTFAFPNPHKGKVCTLYFLCLYQCSHRCPRAEAAFSSNQEVKVKAVPELCELTC